jgi:hypothetical protein
MQSFQHVMPGGMNSEEEYLYNHKLGGPRLSGKFRLEASSKLCSDIALATATKEDLKVVVPLLAGLAVAILVVLGAFALWRLVLIRHVRHSTALRFSKIAQGIVSLLALVAFGVTASLLYESANPPSLEEMVCEGKASPASPSYEGSATHTLNFIAIGTSTWIMILGTDARAADWNSQIPVDWRPPAPEQVQLVACLEEQQIELERCQYTGGSDLVRYRRQLSVSLREAHTGDLVAEDTFEGSNPRQCPSTKPSNLRQLLGNPVALDEVLTWLNEYVEGPE